MPPQLIFGPFFWIELAYSLIVIISCGLIYSKAKELYELSSYKGIKYFGNAFLFFGIAYFARLFLRLLAIISGPSRTSQFYFFIGFILFLYAGLMAGFYLIYSSLWKKIKNSEKLGWISHPIALMLAVLAIIFLLGQLVLVLLGGIFLIAALLAYFRTKKNKEEGIKQLHVTYILLFTSWVASGAAHLFIRISAEASILLYGVSSILFIIILHRMMRSINQ